MLDPDIELAKLEGEFPRSSEALVTRAPEYLTRRLVSIAREHALSYATGRTEAPFSPGIGLRSFFSSKRPSQEKGLSKSASENRDAMRTGKLMHRAMLLEAPGPNYRITLGDHGNDAQRLRGRDRDTWLQRIAELILQGDLQSAERLIAAFRREFDE